MTSIGSFFACYFLLLGICLLVKQAIQQAVEFEYRTGFLTRTERDERHGKVEIFFTCIIMLLPFFVPVIGE